MSALSDLPSRVSSPLLAALLLLARALLAQLRLPHPTAAQVLEATGASRSRAYELRDRLQAALPTLVGPVGRPAAPESTPAPDQRARVSRAVLDFVMAHPGCVYAGEARHCYADVFRHRMLELREQYGDLELSAFAEAIAVPLGTIEDWLRAGRRHNGDDDAPAPPQTSDDEVTDARVQTVITQWRAWHGDFTIFCQHVRHHHRLTLSTSCIADILFKHGERTPRRRRGRGPDEEALRGCFKTFFPGAQWVGDGSQVQIVIGEQPFNFNLELDVDADSGALVGLSVRDTEDSAAVVETFDNAVETTGAKPLALLLDNKPSNHSAEVADALDDTVIIRATPKRPQNKAHVEGAFGLFSQHAPPMDIDADSPGEMARQIVMLVVLTWARTLNHRPRTDRGGQNRVQLYRDTDPTAEQIEAAKQALVERMRRQQLARQTSFARAEPAVRQLLDQAFARLDLDDPDAHFRSVIAGYCRDAIVEAIAIFEGKMTASTLPDNADARYLLGIVKNRHHLREAEAITEALILWRTRARDIALRGLEQQRDEQIASAADTHAALRGFVDCALRTQRTLDRQFWTIQAAELIRRQPQELHNKHFRAAARRIHTTFAIDTRQRSAAERALARALWPFD